jgi:recombination protein RecT
MADKDGKDLTNKLATKQAKGPGMTVAQFFEREMPNIAAVMPEGTMKPQRMVKLAIQIWSGNPKLAACDKNSFVAALITCAQFGLEPNTPLGQCHIIAYGGKATFQLGYPGILELAYRTDKYKSIYVREVYKDDDFKVTYGLFEDLVHIPSEEGPAIGELPVYIYAVYHTKNGGYGFEVWSYKKIMNHAKTYSKTYDKKTGKFYSDSSWNTAPVSMAKKTVLIALMKYAPKSIEMAQAMEFDNTAQQDTASKREYMDIDYTIKDDEKETSSPVTGQGTDIPAGTQKADTKTAKKDPVKDAAPEFDLASTELSQEELDRLAAE